MNRFALFLLLLNWLFCPNLFVWTLHNITIFYFLFAWRIDIIQKKKSPNNILRKRFAALTLGSLWHLHNWLFFLIFCFVWIIEKSVNSRCSELLLTFLTLISTSASKYKWLFLLFHLFTFFLSFLSNLLLIFVENRWRIFFFFKADRFISRYHNFKCWQLCLVTLFLLHSLTHKNNWSLIFYNSKIGIIVVFGYIILSSICITVPALFLSILSGKFQKPLILS